MSQGVKRNHNNNNSNNHQHYNNRQHGQQPPKKFRVHSNQDAELFVSPLFLYEKPFPDFKKPREIGNFISEKRKKDLEARQIIEKNQKGFKYLSLPDENQDIKFDLKLGLSKFVDHIPHQHGIDTLLEWIVQNKKQLVRDNSTKPLKADFICWRGLVSALANAPYEKQKDFMFGVILYKGTYYMAEFETEKQRAERENMDEMSRNFTYWGHKFESYITSDLPDEKPSEAHEDAPDPENNFSSVYETSLSEHALVYAAEIDCCFNNNNSAASEPIKYCEIKTHKGESVNDINKMIHRNFKFLKWWIQSFLVDIQMLKVGLRDDAGIVSKVVDFNINEIARSNENKPWKETVCFNFLKSVLDLIKQFCVEEKQLYIAYRGCRDHSVKFSRANHDSEIYKKHYFLRDWFVDTLI